MSHLFWWHVFADFAEAVVAQQRENKNYNNKNKWMQKIIQVNMRKKARK